MSDFSGKRCDGEGCESIKRQANHWFVVIGGPGSVSVVTEEHLRNEEMVVLDGYSKQDACGEECTQKLVSAWLSKQKDNEPAEAVAAL